MKIRSRFGAAFGLALLGLALPLGARMMRAMPLSTQSEKADLIAIARPLAAKDTQEMIPLPNIRKVLADGTKTQVLAKGVETTFEVVAVLKGDAGLKKFVLHHCRTEGTERAPDGPGFVRFDAKAAEPKSYLLFLKKETDGRYTPFNGQTDPNVSIFELSGFVR